LITANDNIVVYWLGIEISLIVFLPFLLNNKFGFELRIKYFLVQTIGSFILIFMFIFRFKIIYLFFFILLLKIGAVPFYSWVVYIAVKIDWNTIFFFFKFAKNYSVSTNRANLFQQWINRFIYFGKLVSRRARGVRVPVYAQIDSFLFVGAHRLGVKLYIQNRLFVNRVFSNLYFGFF